MAFRTPTFNLTCNIYTFNTYGGVPRIAGQICQLRHSEHVSAAYWDATTNLMMPAMLLLLPAHVDVRDNFISFGPGEDQVECPVGTGRVYRVMLVDDVARGFANEYRAAYLRKGLPNWPAPIP